MKLSFPCSVSERAVILLLSALILTGCATSRDVVTPQIDAGINPSQGVAVRIKSIEDLRIFEIAPRDPSTPSLMDANIGDKTLRSRAIARKRNSYGQALGDILLPENQSVTQLTQDVATRSFREAGYRVVAANDPDYARAIPVSIKIDKLWAWFQPGFWSLALDSNYSITVSAPIEPLKDHPQFNGQVRNTMQMATVSDWSDIVKKSLDDFAARLKEKLQK